MADSKLALNPSQETIQVLAAMLAAIYLETEDQALKQFINMMLGAAAAEYKKNTGDGLTEGLFMPKELTKTFRESIALMRSSLLASRLYTPKPGLNGNH